MSGVDVLGAVSAALSLLEAAVVIIGRIRKAHERQEDLVRVLSSHHDEIESIRNIIQIVQDEEALRTAAIAAQLVRIEVLATSLVDCLNSIDPETKSSMRQFAHQLVQGSKDEKALANIMDKLGHAKSSLSLRIQVANVGLTRIVGDRLVANSEVISRVDLVLQQVFGEGRGLKVAELLQNRPAQDNGMVPLSDSDIACLSDELSSLPADADATPKPAANNPTSRIVIDNLTEGQALQINGPIGKRGWWEVVHLEIKNNKAANESIQINHAISEEIFNRLLTARAAGSQG